MEVQEKNPKIGFLADGAHRDLLVNLTLKDFKLRYRNSALGFIWSLLNPLSMMVVLTIFYEFVFQSSIANFPAFVLPALLTWRFFAVGTSSSLDAIAGNASLVTKVYFPRWLLVLSNAFANFLGSSLEFIALFPLMILLGVKLGVAVILLPLVLIMTLILVIGASLILSSLNVISRDFAQVWEIFLQAGFFLDPIFYSQSIVPARYQVIYSVNPIAQLVEMTRTILYYGELPSILNLGEVLASTIIIIALGVVIFTKLEKRFGELV
jgi:ABC-type polysaccharide/polyol phosphate export permease